MDQNRIEELKKRPFFQMNPNLVKNLKNNICTFCNEEVTNFRDEKSVKEYNISGMCQKCQDKIFGGS